MKSVKEREEFYSQEKEYIESLRPQDPGVFYRLCETGQYVCHMEIDLGLGEDSVEIAHIADCHLNFANERDMSDAETPYTLECRKAFRNGVTLPSTENALKACAFSDATVVNGDILDYITYGTLDAVKEHIVDAFPDIMMTVGWHDMTKQMQTKRPNLLSDAQRQAMLQEIWPHDIHYYSRVIGKKITVVCLGTRLISYSADFYDKLSAEIDRARREGRYILIFQHEPLATRRECDREVTPAFTRTNGYGVLRNFCDGEKIMAREGDPEELTLRVYELLRSNADVVKGIFAGHYHNQFYTEIPAYTEKDGVREEAVIPQYVVHIAGVDDGGYLMRIILK